jgi:hypothetical protein
MVGMVEAVVVIMGVVHAKNYTGQVQAVADTLIPHLFLPSNMKQMVEDQQLKGMAVQF